MNEQEKDLQPEQQDPKPQTEKEKIDVVKGIEALETQLIETQQLLEQAQKETEVNQEVFKRTLAEYDNYRKRTGKEKTESYTSGMVNTVLAMLPVIDTLEMALSAPCTDEAYKKGIEMTMAAAKDALNKLGIEEIDALNKPFDPNLHAAVMQEEIEDVESGIVTKQFQKGYKTAEKIIRHATVAVRI